MLLVSLGLTGVSDQIQLLLVEMGSRELFAKTGLEWRPITGVNYWSGHFFYQQF
jgi:hypothetical protein